MKAGEKNHNPISRLTHPRDIRRRTNGGITLSIPRQRCICVCVDRQPAGVGGVASLRGCHIHYAYYGESSPVVILSLHLP